MRSPTPGGYTDLLDDLISATYPDRPAAKKELALRLVRQGDADELTVLLHEHAADVSVNSRDRQTGRTLLHEACVAGQLDSVKVLVQKAEADIMLRTMMGRCTPLHLAVSCNHRAVAFFLLSHGADAASRDRFGCSPMHYVKSVSVAKLLVQYGAKVLDYNPKKKNALDSVEMRADLDENPETCRELVKYLRGQAESEYKAKLERLRQIKEKANTKQPHRKPRSNMIPRQRDNQVTAKDQP